MEDSVPAAEKRAARNTVAEHLPRLAVTGAAVIPRVNDLASGLLEDDLAAVVGPHVQGVSVGKIDSAEDVRQVSRMLDSLEAAAGLERGSVGLIPWIETARGIVNAYDICSRRPG